MRIVSLLPSATEIICSIGLGDQLVGVSHECDYPTFVSSLPRVTQTLIPNDASSREIDDLVRERLKTERALYSLDLPTLESLQPDLIVTQALCDVCAVAEKEVTAAACALPGQPQVINLEPACLEDVFRCMQLIGDATGTADQAAAAIAQLRQRVERVVSRAQLSTAHPKVVLLEWIDPPFSSGHWSPELVRLAGGIEQLGREGQRSHTTAWQEVLQADPDCLVIACCGFDIKRTLLDIPILTSYPGFDQLMCVQSDNVYLVDGNAYFNRPGPRLVDSLEILAHILQPTIHALPQGLPGAYRLNKQV